MEHFRTKSRGKNKNNKKRHTSAEGEEDEQGFELRHTSDFAAGSPQPLVIL